MKMIFQSLLSLAVLLPFPSVALDESAAGLYAIIHRDGNVTQKIFRVRYAGTAWHLEDKKADGTWQDVTCEEDCVLEESTSAEVETFLGPVPKGTAAECVNNKAFAFCRMSRANRTGESNHILVALVTGKPIPIRLARLPEQQKK